MLWANALHIQCFCQLIKAAVEVGAELHEVFDVVYNREIDLQANSTLKLRHSRCD